MEKKSYDFSGWATRNNVKCADGASIVKDAFADQNGATVPLVWNHGHTDMKDVIGHALLENRDDGVYTYAKFNDTEGGKRAKELVKAGDIRSLSIYANKLTRVGASVTHGTIREVSLVLAGANPGAYIDRVIVHSLDASTDTEELDGIVYTVPEEIKHGEELEPSLIFNNSDDDIEHSDKSNEEGDNKMEKTEPKSEKTVKEVFDTLTEEQKTAVYAIIGAALEDKDNNKENEGDNQEMKHNAFENENVQTNTMSKADATELIHSAMEFAKKNRLSMRQVIQDAVDQANIQNEVNYTMDEVIHTAMGGDAISHSITNIGELFPNYQSVNKTPYLIQRDMGWVSKVMGAVHHTPFSRIKSTAANITAAEARAKGYVKGNQKVEEVIVALGRTTDPQTVYKLQKMDRDDIIDITDFDVVAFLKAEMRVMLEEEIARAILIGDGRAADSPDKIKVDKVRPILGDNNVYTTQVILKKNPGETSEQFAKRLIEEVIRQRKNYKGSGNPTWFTSEDQVTEMLLIKDLNQRYIYDDVSKLATRLRVKEIVTVPVFEGQYRENEAKTKKFYPLGIMVNLGDYNVGADKGGSVNMFDDFDIDYNKYSYLIETRISGALVKPYSAISFEEEVDNN